MKVTIVVPGRFHAFQLALQLQQQGYLHCLITSYPKFEVAKYNIERKFIRSVVTKEIIQRFFKKLTGRYPKGVFLNNWFDWLASFKIPPDSDIYIIWAGFGLNTMRRIRKINPSAKCIIERGSAHIEAQNELLKMTGAAETNKKIIEKEKLEYAEADFISVPGIFSKATFINKQIPAEKIFANCYGVDLKKFAAPGRIFSDKETFVVGYTGIISSRKNIEGLIHACLQLSLSMNIKLLLAGPVDDSFNKDLLNESFIDYKGVLPENELPALYKELDVFVLNSIEDGFGMVLLQAMATGVVPIATFNTGGPDIIRDGENGFLIPVQDDNTLGEKLEWLYSNKASSMQMSKQAVLSVQDGFSWDDYGRRAINFYSELCKQKDQ